MNCTAVSRTDYGTKLKHGIQLFTRTAWTSAVGVTIYQEDDGGLQNTSYSPGRRRAKQ